MPKGITEGTTVAEKSLILTFCAAPAKAIGCCLSFTLEMRNVGSGRILLPYPPITDLRFQSATSRTVAEWYTDRFVSVDGCATVILESHTSRLFDLDARLSDVQVKLAEYDYSNFARWYVELPPGKYTAQYHYEVNDRFNDPDSHCTMKDLEWDAARQDAVVWRGRSASNALTVVRPPIGYMSQWTTARDLEQEPPKKPWWKLW